MELFITGPGGSVKTLELRDSGIRIGRAADNDLAYPTDAALSRHHICIKPATAGWVIEDCGSLNGTVVNGERLEQSHRLEPGDRVYAGQLVIEVRDPAQSSNSVVTFVREDTRKLKSSSTVVTSLDKALRQAAYHKNAPPAATRALAALIRAGQELAGHRPLGELFEVILDLALSAIEASRGVILTIDNGQLAVRASRGEDFSISTAVRDRVLREKSSLMISDAQFDPALREQKSIVAQSVRSILAAPLQAGDQVIGLIYVDNGKTLRPFSQEDLDLLTVMAHVAAIRIEHARLIAVEQEEKLMLFELAQATEIQQSLLATEPPVCEGYEVTAFNLPCRAVGGDYYDFLTYEDGRLGFVVADVCGKGLAAALMTSSLQARVHMLRESYAAPAAAMTALNRSLGRRFPLGRFITLFYGLLEPSTGNLLYANAGHNHPFLLRHSGAVERLRQGGLVLGLCPDVEYQTYTAQLQPGDMLALYSDGVTEASKLHGEQFGDTGLAEFLVENRGRPCCEIMTELVAHVRSWSGRAAFEDDFTAVLLRRQLTPGIP
ncbi:MAG: SpoIIE family protein phosphatase [Acidobacteriaceae bacterium]|nr:SpoIIE family protein phosphatase [Acidobacteriaceae bacterium]